MDLIALAAPDECRSLLKQKLTTIDLAWPNCAFRTAALWIAQVWSPMLATARAVARRQNVAFPTSGSILWTLAITSAPLGRGHLMPGPFRRQGGSVMGQEFYTHQTGAANP
jgi:hypothetical protein